MEGRTSSHHDKVSRSNTHRVASFDSLALNRDAYCEMKIKEKGLTGKAAQLRRNNLRKPGGFNGLELQKKDKTATPAKKKEVYLQFWGKTIRVYDDGKVKEEDIPEHIDGATLKWSFSEGESPESVSFKEIKVLGSSHLSHPHKFARLTRLGSTLGSTQGEVRSSPFHQV